MRRLTGILSSAALLAGGLTACNDSNRGDLDSLRSYVAIGDSYTAAPGTGGFSGPQACLQSSENYPHQVAEQAELRLTDVSCSGATSSAVAGKQKVRGRSIDPQIDAVGADTDIVTVRIGANDFNLIGRVILFCVQLAASDPKGSPCTDADTKAGDRSAANVMDEVEDNLVEVLADVRAAAPEAEVVVLGYPEIFPSDRTCPDLPLATGDLAFARAVVDGLNEAAEAAARKSDLPYIDVFDATRGHHICSRDPWVAGATVAAGRASTPWHPYVEEQEAVAKLVLAAID